MTYATRRRRAVAPTVVAALTASLLLASNPAAAAQGCVGFTAVGSPGEDVNRKVDAGSVTVFESNPAGTNITPAGARLITQESIGQVSETGDAMGTSIALADWNGDFCTDLVVGIPGEDAGRGIAVVILNSESGLDTTRRVVLRQGAGGAQDTAEAGDRFGTSMAAGGINVMGSTAALVIGVPGEDLLGRADAGAAMVFRTSTAGGSPQLTRAGVLLRQGLAPFGDSPEKGDAFGSVVSIGGRGIGSALAIGVPGEDIAGVVDAGAVHQSDPYAEASSSFVHQNSTRVLDENEAGDRFGSAIGWTGSCQGGLFYPALVVGVPGEDVAGQPDAGAVILHEIDEFTSAADFMFVQGSGGVSDRPEAGDGFGSVITSAESAVFVGTPREDVGRVIDAGMVTSIRMGCVGSTPPFVMGLENTRSYSQNSTGVPDDAEAGDRFGGTLGATSVVATNSESARVLLVGSPGESVGTRANAGSLTAFPVPFDSPLGSGLVITQNTAGVPDTAEKGDRFGGGLESTFG